MDRTRLFDLKANPHEMTHLADKPEHAEKITELTALLTKEMKAAADAALLTVISPAPAEWTPPTAGERPAKRAAKKVQK